MKLLDLLAQLKTEYNNKNKSLKVTIKNVEIGEWDIIYPEYWNENCYKLVTNWYQNYTILEMSKIYKYKNKEYELFIWIDLNESINVLTDLELEIKEF